MVFCPSYNLPKNKRKTRHRSIYPKELNSEVRLRNGKVLGIHSAQTEFGLLDSYDQHTLYAWYEWYVVNITNLTNINSNKFILWMYPLLLKKSDLFLWIKENEIWFIKKKLDLFLCRQKKKKKFCEQNQIRVCIKKGKSFL